MFVGWNNLSETAGHRLMGVETIYCSARTSIPDKSRIYPCLRRDLAITRADHVWCGVISFVPMLHGHTYLCAVEHYQTRCVLCCAGP